MYQIRLVNRDGTTETIYDQSQMNDYSVIAPKYSFEIGEAGSLSFTLNPDHPLIDELKPIASHVQALDDGEEIFYGRVIQRTDPTLSGQVTFQCEGALTFLLDSEIPPYGKDSSGNQITKSLTAEQFLNECITAHNADVNEARRQFTVGIVNATNRGETADYSITSFTQTKSALESQLVNNYGGFLRTRPNPQGGRFIDWIENYSTVNPQAITIGENVLSQTNEAEGTSLFTVLRPVGDDGITLTEKTIDLYSAEDMAKYGRIVKTIEFKGADTEAKLRTEATKYKNKACTTLFQNSSIQLVDMHYLDGTVPKIHGGDRFTNIHGLEGEEMTAASLEIDFENPQNSSVGLKNRKSLDPDMTPEGNAHRGRGAVSRSSHRSSNAVGQHFKTLKETGDDLEILAKNLHMQGETLIQHYQTIQTQAGNIETLSSRVDTAEGVIASHTTQFDGITYRVRQIEGTGVIQNSQAITQIAGKFEVLNGSDDTTIVHLKDGAEFAVDGENGTTINVGTRLLSVIDETNAMASFVNTFQGSALWNQRDQIAGVCGEYDVVEERVPDPEHTGEYLIRKTLVIRSGGGMRIRKDGAEYGVYMSADRAFTPVTLPPDVTGINPRSNHWYEKNGDEYRLTTDTTAQSGKTYYIQETNKNAVLTGGLMVEKINNDTTTKIRGDRVEITAQDVKIVADKTLDTVVGHFTEEEFEYEDEEGETQIGHRLVYIADGGMKVRRVDENDVVTEYGVYDEETLTAGVITEKVNNDRTTYIVGDRIVIQDRDDNDWQLADWCKDREGLIAARATIRDLKAAEARISTLEADYITSQNIKSVVGDINQLLVKRIAGSQANSDAYFDTFQGHHFEVSISGGGNQTYTRDLIDGIYDIQIVPPGEGSNTYTLQKKSITANSWTTVGTFSRATQLSGTWSSDTLTVSAAPQGNEYKIGFTGTVDQKLGILGNGTPTKNSSNDKHLDVPLQLVTFSYVSSQDPNHVTTRHSETITFDATPVWNAGQTNGKASVTLLDPYWNQLNSGTIPSSRTVTVKTSGQATPQQKDIPLFLTQDPSFSSHKKNVYLKMTSATGNTYAQIEVDASGEYSAGETDGKNAVTLLDPYWNQLNSGTVPSSRTVTVKTSGQSTPQQKDIPLFLTQDPSFSSHKKNVYLKMTSATGNTYAQIEVDASGEYSTGVTAGKGAVTLVGPNWDNGGHAYGDNNWTPTSRSVAFSLGGGGSGSYSQWIGIGQVGNHVYLYKDSWNGTRMAGVTISNYHANPHYYCAEEVTQLSGGKQMLYKRSQNASGYVYTEAFSGAQYVFYRSTYTTLSTYYS